MNSCATIGGMKPLAGLLLLIASASLVQAENVPFQKTEGALTFYALDWQPSQSIPEWLSARSGNPFGLWVTACVTEGRMPTKAVVTFRSGEDEATRIGAFSGPPHGCVSVMIPGVRRADVVSLLIVTNGVEVGSIQ